jgi:hypothetical protein
VWELVTGDRANPRNLPDLPPSELCGSLASWCRAPQTDVVIALPVKTLHAVRGVFDAHGTPTLSGLDTVAALEQVTAARMAGSRQAHLKKASLVTIGCVVLCVLLLSILRVPVADNAPMEYGASFVICVLGAALTLSHWRDAHDRINAESTAAWSSQLRTIEAWKTISTMRDALVAVIGFVDLCAAWTMGTEWEERYAVTTCLNGGCPGGRSRSSPGPRSPTSTSSESSSPRDVTRYGRGPQGDANLPYSSGRRSER